MNAKKWVIVCLVIVVNVIVFTQRETIKNRWVQGNEVSFPLQNTEDKKAPRIYIVGSEATIQTKLVERISKKCTKVHITTKVNRFTNLEWQERNELHRFIREGMYDFVIIETEAVDFSKVNLDRIARFDSSAKKSNSKLVYWSLSNSQKYPSNFLVDLPKNLDLVCSVFSR